MPSIPCFWIEKADGAWVRPDTGELQPYPSAFGHGAVFSSESTYVEEQRKLGLWKDYPDGLRLCVVTPGGEWEIDGPAYPGGGQPARPCPWTRTGDPRKIETLDVNPSINFPGRYHGFLRHGNLIDA